MDEAPPPAPLDMLSGGPLAGEAHVSLPSLNPEAVSGSRSTSMSRVVSFG